MGPCHSIQHYDCEICESNWLSMTLLLLHRVLLSEISITYPFYCSWTLDWFQCVAVINGAALNVICLLVHIEVCKGCAYGGTAAFQVVPMPPLGDNTKGFPKQ